MSGPASTSTAAPVMVTMAKEDSADGRRVSMSTPSEVDEVVFSDAVVQNDVEPKATQFVLTRVETFAGEWSPGREG